MPRRGRADAHDVRRRHREPPVEAMLDVLSCQGWQVLRGLPTPAGSVGRLLTGPGGAFALATRTMPGRVRASAAPDAWVRQAQAQADAAAAWLGGAVTPLLVLSGAELERSGAEHRGVVVVAGRDLVAFLQRSARRANAPAPG